MRSAPRGQTFLSVMTLGEIEKGIALRARKDKAGAASLSRWLDGVRQRFAGRILPVDDAVALEWGRLSAIRSRPVADALIAATASVSGKIVVTRNVADFADAGVQIINPWAL